MKIIHCSDIHLDSPLTAGFPPEKAEERRNEILLTFVRMVKYASAQGARAVIIAGDWFDSTQLSSATVSVLKKSMADNPGMDFIYLPGNHDGGDQDIKTLVRMDGATPNLRVLTGPDRVIRLEENVVITGADSPNELSLNPDDVNIVVYHGDLNPDDWKHKDIDYLALGHYHSLKEGKLDGRGIYCYSGCIEGRGYDECGDKGFVRLDINDRKIVPTFVKASKRTIHEIKIDISAAANTGEIDRMIEERVKNISPSDMIMIRLTGKVPPGVDRNLSYLSKKFNDVFYHVKLSDSQVETEIDEKNAEFDKSIKGEFVRLVMESDLSEEDKKAVIDTGLAALQGAGGR